MSKVKKEPLKSLKGMEDILPSDVAEWQEIERRFFKVFEGWNFKEIRTPVLEPIELFKRSIGEETDIVSKEMFAFKDRGDRALALRPEMTASVVRSYIQHRLGERSKSLGLYYWGSMYRAERPQKGRKREFYQAGCELFGSHHPFQDIVLITVLSDLLRALGLDNYQLKINHLGTFGERADYLETLKQYLEKYRDELSEDSQRRLSTNVLRVFDSKVPGDIEITKNAPKIADSLGEKSKAEFELIQSELSRMNIAVDVEPRIVRGLDYYTGFVFEVTHPALGAQDAIGAGGRYDGLIESLGGNPTGASGFALGIERLLLALEGEKKCLRKEPDLVYFAALSPDYFSELHELRRKISRMGYRTEADYLQNALKKQLSSASKLSAKVAVILGEVEMQNKKVLVKDMTSGNQVEVSFEILEEAIKKILEK